MVKIAGEQLTDVVARAIASGLPFAICHEPSAGHCNLYACHPAGLCVGHDPADADWFEIGEWLKPYNQRLVIPGALSVEEFMRFAERHKEGRLAIKETAVEISKKDYIQAVEEIINECKRRRGKTVYSRLISGIIAEKDIPRAAVSLFDAFPKAFGFIFYTPQTGLWLGATPETLLDFDPVNRRLSTMAYAGTRKACGDMPWDAKNLIENQFVSDYITRRMREKGVTPEVHPPHTSRYGDIEHLCRNIEATLPREVEYAEILDAINPTPALCGVPCEAAIADIVKYEKHERGCYGGFVAIRRADGSVQARVHLRSARLSPVSPHHAPLTCNGERRLWRYGVIVGGGIVADSDPHREWEETVAKSRRLLTILRH